MKKINKLITGFVIVLLFVLAACAFALSFDVLRNEAIAKGVNPALAFLFPIIVDSCIIAGSAFVIWASINRQGGLVIVGYVVIALVTILSVVLNGSHAKSFDALTVVYFVVPPMLLAMLTFLVERMLEVVMKGVEHDNQLQTKANRLQGTVTQLESTLRQLQTSLQVEQATRKQLESDYNQVADIIALLPHVNPDVFLFAKVKAGLLAMDEALQLQETYTRKHQAEAWAQRVTIQGVSGD
ncbi:MAG: DUF2637 domain-containing protein [Anaerolineales bacterium]|nr:DUF2637 domain-containing protein [Anaerolineales bacterium]